MFFSISEARTCSELLLYAFDELSNGLMTVFNSGFLEVNILYYTNQFISILKSEASVWELNKLGCSGIFIWDINIQKPSYILNVLIAPFSLQKINYPALQ